MSRQETGVFPSGVPFTVRAFIGGDMEKLSTTVGDIGAKAFVQLIKDCVISIGDVAEITDTLINRLLTNDRKYLLIFLRQFSLNFKENFEFTHEWAVDGDGQKKDVTPHSVVIDSFETIPYYWVKERIEKLTESNEEFEKEFPIVYTNYEEMLSNNLNQTTTLKSTGMVVSWDLLTGAQENLFAHFTKKQRHINLPIVMRNPRTVLKAKKGDGDQLVKYETSTGDFMDLEQIRGEIREKEGNIDTSLSIKHPELEKVAQIDLIGTLAFFVPSLAI